MKRVRSFLMLVTLGTSVVAYGENSSPSSADRQAAELIARQMELYAAGNYAAGDALNVEITALRAQSADELAALKARTASLVAERALVTDSYNDDMYGTFDRATYARNDAQRTADYAEGLHLEAVAAQRTNDEAVISGILNLEDVNAVDAGYYGDVAYYSYDASRGAYVGNYSRKFSMFVSPTYIVPTSYYDYGFDSAYFLVNAYNMGGYQISVVGGHIYVEPRYNFYWGWNPYTYYNYNYYHRYGWYNPYYSWGGYYDPFWGWDWYGYGYWRHDYYYGWGNHYYNHHYYNNYYNNYYGWNSGHNNHYRPNYGSTTSGLRDVNYSTQSYRRNDSYTGGRGSSSMSGNSDYRRGGTMPTGTYSRGTTTSTTVNRTTPTTSTTYNRGTSSTTTTTGSSTTGRGGSYSTGSTTGRSSGTTSSGSTSTSSRGNDSSSSSGYSRGSSSSSSSSSSGSSRGSNSSSSSSRGSSSSSSSSGSSGGGSHSSGTGRR